jgi:hypothetical protein
VRALALALVAGLCLYLSAAPAHADWSGDRRADVLAVDSAGRLLLYRGTGAGAFVAGGGSPIGTGWGGFTALLAPGDWSGDGRPDLLARTADGLLLLYRGNGKGGFLSSSGEQIGSGWSSLGALTLVWNRPPPVAPAPPAPPTTLIPQGSAKLRFHEGLHAPRRSVEGPRPHPPPRRPRPAAGALRRLLREARRQAGRPPPPVRRAAADESARRQAGPRLRAGLLPPRKFREVAAQDGVEAVQDVPRHSVN